MPERRPVRERLAEAGVEVVGDPEDALALDDGVAAGDAFLERAEPGHQLEGRAGRVVAGDGALEERLLGVFEQGRQLVLAAVVAEDVVVVAGQADQGQDLAGLGVADDRHADVAVEQPLLEHLGDRLLEVEVDRHDQVLARLGTLDAQRADLAAGRLDLVHLAAGPASEDGLVRVFDAGRADLVVDRVAVLLDLLLVLGGREDGRRDRAEVAEDVGQQAAIGVLARGLDGDLDAGQVRQVLLDQQRVLARHVRLDGDGIEGVPLGLPLFDGLPHLWHRHADELAEARVGLRLLGGLEVGRDDRDDEDRRVGRGNRALTVVDDAARGRDLTDPDTVVVGALSKLWPFDDLKSPELGGEQREGDEDCGAEEMRRQPGGRAARLVGVEHMAYQEPVGLVSVLLRGSRGPVDRSE